MSPSRSAASGPPFDASGATCPTMNPCVAPEKRPSVISATDSDSPSPTIAAGDVEHLAHARRAGRPLVSDHDDVAGLEHAGFDRGEALLLRLEHAGRAAVLRAVVAGELHDAPLGSEVAAQDRDPSARLDRGLDRHDDGLAHGLARGRGVGEGPPVDSRASGERALVSSRATSPMATRAVDVLRVVAAPR